MRQLYVDVRDDNEVKKISFYSPAEGYVGFTSWIGFTTDSGRTFTRKYITYSNVDFGSYSVNLTFGFGVSGVKAFNKDTLIVFGDYGAVPAILYSTDQGNSFRLIYQSQLNTQKSLEGSVKDMIFPTNRDVGYAVEADRIIKTVDRGKNWFVTLNSPNSFYDVVEAVDDNTVFAFSTYFTNKFMKTTNGGTTWQQLTVPAGTITYAHFISSGKGWLNMNYGSIYYTSNGGTSWQLKNGNTSVYALKMKFINDSTGYATGESFRIYKTTDSGKVWEPLPRDNSYEYLGYGHNDLHFWNNNQFWAGGGHGFLEITTNGGGIPLPKAFFSIDTTNLSLTGIVKLVNYSKPNHQYLWYKNDTLISTSYHASYNHKINKSYDSIKLVVTDGSHSDTAISTIYFNVPPPPPIPTITSFKPAIAPKGKTVTITGTNLTGATSVSFGGMPASSFTVISSTNINAVVGNGATGKVSVTTPYGTVDTSGFTFIPAPVISAFTPALGSTGATVTITGSNFTGATAVSFGGIPAASFTVVSDGTITAVLATGGSGSISVIAPGGTASLPGFIFGYPPAITDFTPTVGPTGTVVTIKGNYFAGATAVNFGGVPAASFIVNGDTSITATLFIGVSGVITVTSPFGTGRSIGVFTYVAPLAFDSFSPTIGGTGTRVTINGTSVEYATSITIGGVPIQSIFANNLHSKITVTVGAGATGDIVVTTPYGTVTKGTFIFYPLPVVSSVSPATGTAGTEVTITGMNFDSVQAVKFGGALATSFKVISSTIIKAIIGEGNSGTVSVTTPGGTGSGNNFTFIPSPAPTITSFTPVAAPAGAIVSITGTNFKPDVNGNIVYFGAVKAVVTKATTTNLEVIVPVGATYDYITVTTYNLTAATSQQFSVTPPTLSDITPGSFTKIPDSLITSSKGSNSVFIKDLDGDGKPDIVRTTSKGIVILRNTTTNGNISFSKKINYAFLDFCSIATVGDLDGDGRPEIAVVQDVLNSLRILRNNSSAGNIAFDTTTSIGIGSNLYHINICDMNKDGKPDIYSMNSANASIDFLKNTTQGGSISFRGGPSIRSLHAMPIPVSCDLNGDDKPEIIMEYDVFNGKPPSLAVLRNISNNSTIAFAPLKDIISGNFRNLLSTGDMDGDGKTDVIISTTNGWSVLRNISIDTNFSFQRTDFLNSYRVSPAVGDIDGDGKPDIIVAKGDSISIFKNLSTPGNISFVQKSNYPVGSWFYNAIVCDLNGDQNPEITSTNDVTDKMVVILGNTGSSGSSLIQFCNNNGISLAATTAGTVYQWQMDSGSGFANVNDNSNLNGTHAFVLQLSNVPATWTGYQFRCLTDAIPGTAFNIVVNNSSIPSVTTSGNNNVNSGQAVSILANVTNGGTSPVYQWQDSTTAHTWLDISGATTSTLTYTPTATGNKVRVKVTSNASCASPAMIISTPITFTVNMPTAINPVPAANYGIHLYPNPVTTSLTIDTLSLSDQWQTLEIRNVEGVQTFVQNIQNQTKIVVWAAQLSKGIYVAVLRKKNGEAVYLKFVKM
ncbi:hypothetical protein A3860_11640 [Niastella vici]|uniref:IPT/TIG domain-containing protein n=1 Tax=Niastella vici TaxID=1703345 RepID=A0A1V9FFS1_9BACT|nr:IPT/TIG domain-containing protein [Niastella vici]OQP57205.1 hypothetical protein A3860_11640 [Niastella vici]